MVSKNITGRDVLGVFTDFNYFVSSRTGSHVTLKWRPPRTDEIRTVTVPDTTDTLPRGTLGHIAEQCGADDFEEWYGWIRRNS